MGLNTVDYVKYIRDRMRLLNNSIKRQAQLTAEMIKEHENLQSESKSQSKKMGATIKTLKAELRTVVKQLNNQQKDYDEGAAQVKVQLTIKEENKKFQNDSFDDD